MESLFFALALTFLLTYFYMPNFILRIKSSGYLIIDRYKPEKTELPTHGAVLVLFTMLLVCSITPVVFGVLRRLGFTDNYVLINEIDFAILFVILAYGIFGFIDELINIKWLSKSLYPIFFSFPLVMLLPIITTYEWVLPLSWGHKHGQVLRKKSFILNIEVLYLIYNFC